ncbi:MAG: menaquinol-cytochrome c reductase cytochrome b subunit, partial [Acidimicrobiia bacterium]|nr:menaquinol-cytochrome c reductase cytochrome b subunit [Acidimicrobiia bacterium]
MTEIPEHLRKRAAEAKAKAQGPSDEGSAEGGSSGGESAPSGAASKIPAHLLQRSKSAKSRGDEGAGTAVAATTGGGTAVATAPAPAAVPTMTGPAGHTQRLLTVVKSGSIQDIKAQPLDKVHTWPHLIVVEFGAALAVTAFLTIFSI